MKKALILILAGVAVGLFLAPDKGSETFNKLVKGFDDLKDKAMDEINDLVGKGKDVINKGKKMAGEASGKW
jgi:gas vesicle protein